MAFESKAITSDASTTIATIAVDTVSGVDYPVSQLIVGSDGGSKSLVTGSTGLPVDLVAGSALTSLQLIDDIVHVDDAAFTLGSSKGIVMMGFAGTQSVNANDAAALACDTYGALHISDGGNSITVDGTITANLSDTDNAVLDTMVTALQLIDDAVYTDGSGTPSKGVLMMGSDTTNPQALICSPTGIGYGTTVTSDGSNSAVFRDDAAASGAAVVMAGFVFDDGSPDSVDEGDAGYARMSANRNLYVNIRDNAGNERGLNIDASGNLTANLSATDNAVLDAMVVDLAAIEVLLGTIDADTGSIKTAVELLDDVIYADDADWTDCVSKHILTGGLYQLSPQTITDGDVGPLSVDQYSRLVLSGTNPIDVSAATVTVTGTVTANLSAASDGTYIGDIKFGESLPAGSAAIGKLAANSGVDIGDVDVTSIVPGTAATNLGKAQDSASGSTDTGVAAMAIRDDEVATLGADGDYVNLVADEFRRLRVTNMPSSTSEVKFAKIDAASSGDNTLVAAVGSGIKIRVLSYVIVSAGTVTVRFESGAGGTALTGQMSLVANTGVSAPYCPEGLFETADNALLNMELSGSVSVDGHLTYVEI